VRLMAHGKGGNEDLAALLCARAIDDPSQSLLGLAGRFVAAVAICALHDHEIGAARDLGIAQDGQAAAAHVAAEHQAVRGAAFGDVEHDHRRAQDMAGIAELHGDAGHRLKLVAVVGGDEMVECLERVVDRVERLKWVLMLAPATPVDVRDVRFLDVSGVHEHERAQIAGGGCAPDAAPESPAHERREVPAVVDVGVR